MTGTAKFHVFFTRSKSGLRPNPHVGNRVGGDVFILKVSDTDEVDQYGNNFYVDMERDDLGPGVATDLLWELPIFRPAT